MTIRQRLLRLAYPLWVPLSRRLQGSAAVRRAPEGVQPAQSIYDLSVELLDGRRLDLDSLRGKALLVVNTASDCGYTAQYGALQRLYEQSGGRLEILAFPANDFKEQEGGTDAQIAAFCQRHYGVGFPVARKSQVVGGEGQHPVFQWLTTRALNGWNDQAPPWNFTKYLISADGHLTHCFHPAVSPLGRELRQALNP